MPKTRMIKDIMLGNKRKGIAIQFYTCTTCNGASVAKDYGEFNYCPYCGLRIEWRINGNEIEVDE
jgi:predicted RNA-binding Zn-ribbon protein involved in translation (DUF1610 family)